MNTHNTAENLGYEKRHHILGSEEDGGPRNDQDKAPNDGVTTSDGPSVSDSVMLYTGYL